MPRGEDPSAGLVDLAGVILVAFGVAVVAPIVEEIMFRGYLFPALDALEGPVDRRASRAARSSALAHCAVYPPQLLPLMAVFGFFACLLFWFTGSLLPCVALHAMNNALVTGRDLGWGWEIPLFMLGCMAVAVLLLMPFARERAPIPKNQVARRTTRMADFVSARPARLARLPTTARPKAARRPPSMIVGIVGLLLAILFWPLGILVSHRRASCSA